MKMKPVMFIIGGASFAAAIFVLDQGEYPTSGLMLLSFGIVTLLVASVLKYKNFKKR
jgi:tellurite resistance protein TehA-like permease